MSFDALTILLIVCGGSIMLLSIFKTFELLKILSNKKYVKSWKVLLVLMFFFFTGYFAVVYAIVYGWKDFVFLATGIIFLFGSLFVYLVVHLGYLTIQDLIKTSISKEYVEDVLESLQEGIISTNKNGNLVIFNEPAKKLMQKAEILNKDNQMYNVEEKVKRITHSIKVEELFVRDTHDEEVRIVQVRKGPLRNKNGNPQEQIMVFRDVTHERKWEKELQNARLEAEEANRLKSLFLASMSHEIRTPMNGVIAVTGLLLETSLTKKQCEFIHLIRTSGELLLSLINDILDFSKIEAGKMSLEPQKFEIEKCVKDTFDLLKQIAADKKINLIYNISSEVPAIVYGDVSRLRQIIINLLNNAIKFTNQGQVEMTVTAKEIADNIVLQFSVRDTGDGIPKEKISSIFESFIQVDTSKGGYGLGLSICKKLVEMMDGEMWCQNNKDQGSTFFFTVKMGIVSIEEQKSFKSIRNIKRENKKVDLHLDCPLRILVAEDHRVNQDIIKYILHNLGYLADIVSNGFEVLKSLQQKKYDLIFMDINMPEMDGLQTTTSIIEKYNEDRPIIIAMTALAMDGDREKCISRGMDDYISKPIIVDELFRVIQKWSHKKEESVAQKNIMQSSVEEDANEILSCDFWDILQNYPRKACLDLVNNFIISTQQAIDDLEKAIAKENFEEITHLSHKIVGSGSLGAQKLSRLASKIEQSSRSRESIATIQQLYITTEKVFRRTILELEKYVNDNSSF